jgi:phosphoglucosamine mutase
MTLVVDCANGAASGFAPQILRRLGAVVLPIFDARTATTSTSGAVRCIRRVVAAEVVRLGADAGVAYDGDADRALFADARGNVIDGDQVLAACAIAMHERDALAGDLVVTTVMANLGFHRAMRDAGIRVAATQVGDRYVLEEMLRTGAVLGGEQSGHVIFREQATTGDGLLTAVRFLSLAAVRSVSLEEVASCMRRFPQVLLNIPVARPEGLEAAEAVWEAVRRAEDALGDGGRVLVRASGTEPLVRVMVEAEEGRDADRHAGELADTVRASLGGS